MELAKWKGDHQKPEDFRSPAKVPQAMTVGTGLALICHFAFGVQGLRVCGYVPVVPKHVWRSVIGYERHLSHSGLHRRKQRSEPFRLVTMIALNYSKAISLRKCCEIAVCIKGPEGKEPSGGGLSVKSAVTCSLRGNMARYWHPGLQCCPQSYLSLCFILTKSKVAHAQIPRQIWWTMTPKMRWHGGISINHQLPDLEPVTILHY